MKQAHVIFDDSVIDGHGVVLRPLCEEDIPLIVRGCSDAHTQRWLPLPNPYTDKDARFYAFDYAQTELDSGAGIQRGIEVDGHFVGVIGLKETDRRAGSTAVGYWLGPWARGRGIMARALSAMSDWALDSQGIGRVELRAAPGNHASLHTAERAGFVREGLLRRAGYVHTGPTDLVVFSRLAADPRPTF